MNSTVVGVRAYRRAGWKALIAVGAAGALLAGGLSAPAFAATGGPDHSGYSFTDSTEAGGPAGGPFTSIAATGTDIGNHGDEDMTTVSLPFPVGFYDDANVTNLNVNSNGNIQFDTNASQYGVTDLPTSTFYTAMLPFWADLVTDVGSDGIFTQTSGSAPNRQFVIEWDAHTYNSDPTAGVPEQFQVVLTENSPTIEYRYLNVSLNDGTSDVAYVAGIQGGDGSNGDYLQYNTGSVAVTNDLAVDYTRVPPNSVTTVSASPSAGSTYGQLVTLTAHVARTDGGTAAPTGTVTFSDNGNALGTVSLNTSGQAVLATRRLAYGGAMIAATYSGDANTDSTRGSIAYYDVATAATTTSLNVADGNYVNYGYGIIATIGVVRPGGLTPGGEVLWYDDITGNYLARSAVINGKALLPRNVLTPGQYQLDAYYPGATGYQYSQLSHIGITVGRSPVTTTLASAANPAPAGTPVAYTATVTPLYAGTHPTGVVMFYKNGQLVRTVPVSARGTATTSFPSGYYSMLAFYNGDTNFYASQSNVVKQRTR